MLRTARGLLLCLCVCAPATSFAAQAVMVKTMPLAELALYPQRSAPATAISLNGGLISARIAAEVETILVRVGDVVDAGATLAQLDCADHELALAGNEARLKASAHKRELALARLQRTRSLATRQLVAEETLDEREADHAILSAELESLQAEVAASKLAVSRCAVVSPFDALIVERLGAVGEFVREGTALLRIMDVAEVELSAQILSRDVAQLENAGALRFEHDGARYDVTLRAITQAFNAETRNLEARLLFGAERPLPGASGSLVWRDARAHIPAELLTRRDGELGVFIAEQGRARFYPAPAAQAGRANPVALPPDATLVVEGHFSLKNGDLIDATN